MTLARAFFWFGAAAVLFDIATTFAPPLRPLQKSVVPFTGWAGLFDRGRPRMDGPELRRHLRFTACLLFFYAAFGAFMFLNSGPDHSRNPWLRVSVWQPVWTVLVPAVWGTLLLSRIHRVDTSAV
jgi:hypothetical protein